VLRILRRFLSVSHAIQEKETGTAGEGSDLARRRPAPFPLGYPFTTRRNAYRRPRFRGPARGSGPIPGSPSAPTSQGTCRHVLPYVPHTKARRGLPHRRPRRRHVALLIESLIDRTTPPAGPPS